MAGKTNWTNIWIDCKWSWRNLDYRKIVLLSMITIARVGNHRLYTAESFRVSRKRNYIYRNCRLSEVSDRPPATTRVSSRFFARPLLLTMQCAALKVLKRYFHSIKVYFGASSCENCIWREQASTTSGFWLFLWLCRRKRFFLKQFPWGSLKVFFSFELNIFSYVNLPRPGKIRFCYRAIIDSFSAKMLLVTII